MLIKSKYSTIDDAGGFGKSDCGCGVGGGGVVGGMRGDGGG